MKRAIIVSVGALGAVVAAGCGDDTAASVDSGMDALNADTGGGGSTSSSGSRSDSGGMDASNLASCATTMSAADCPMPSLQKCCAEMPAPTLVCKPRAATCGITQLCEFDTECSAGQTCGPMLYMGVMIHACSPGMATDGGGDSGHPAADASDARGGGDGSSSGDAGDSSGGGDAGAADAPGEGG